MSAVLSFPNVIPFPRGRTVVADLKPDAILRRCRLAAMAQGCTRNQVALAEGHAQGLINKGQKSHAVIAAAESYARQLLTHDRGPTVPGAA